MPFYTTTKDKIIKMAYHCCQYYGLMSNLLCDNTLVLGMPCPKPVCGGCFDICDELCKINNVSHKMNTMAFCCDYIQSFFDRKQYSVTPDAKTLVLPTSNTVINSNQ